MTNSAPEGSHHNPIQLPVGATAEPNTCGTCRFFYREDTGYGPNAGVCRIKLPPWVAEKERPAKVDEDMWQWPRRLKDTDRCDLQHGTGKFYQIGQVIGPSGKLA